MEFTLDHLAQMQEAIKLFNEKKYWECHEALEDPWVENPSDKVRYIYWLVIQVAAMLVHYDKGNLTGMVGLYNKAMDKLKKCEEYKIENQLLENHLNWDHFKNILKSIPANFKKEDLVEISNFKFPEQIK